MTDGGPSPFSELVLLEADLPSDRGATIERSLLVEADDLENERSRTRIEREGDTLRIHIEATDLIALRAATNTWLGLLATAEETAATVAAGV